MRRTLLTAAIAILITTGFPFFLSAQDAETKTGPDLPEETEIILPRMYLEVEDLTIEEIDAVIPDEDAVMLSSIALPLPSPGEISIPAEAFALEDAAVPGRPAAAAEPQGSSFFSESTIGAGTSSRISGDINLYHIGGEPDFRLKYFHDSYDGFAGFSAGEGFSFREELVEAELNYSFDNLGGDLVVGYNEIENGLQGRTDYFSVTRRIPSLEGELRWNFTDLFSLNGSLDASLSGLQLNSLDPAGFNFINLHPSLDLQFGTNTNSVGLRVNYGLDGSFSAAGPDQNMGGQLFFRVEPADIFNLSGEAGVLWNNYSEIFFPFRLDISGASSVLEYKLGGGYRAWYQEYRDLWDIYPAAAGPESAGIMNNLPFTRGWTADGSLRWMINDVVSVSTGAGFSVLENALMPAASSLSGFSYVTAVNAMTLDTSAGMYFKIAEGVSFNVDWEGQMLAQIDWFRPRHSFSSEIEVVSSDKDIGITGGLVFPVYDVQQTWFVNDWLPELNLEAFLRFAEGFVLSVSAEDFAAVFLYAGRNEWDGYLDKGAVLQAKIKISL